MTGQIGDKFLIKGEGYTFISMDGQIDFNPEELGLFPSPSCTACWRGYFCEYSVEDGVFYLNKLFVHTQNEQYPDINGIKAQGVENPAERCFGHCIYSGLHMKVNFNGSLVVGKDFLSEYYIHGGFQRMFAYKKVLELVFRKGVLVKETDISEKAEQMRKRMGERKNIFPAFDD